MSSREQRYLLYQERRVQVLLSKFSNGEIKSLIPEIDVLNGPRYKEVESFVEGQEAIGFLEALARHGILEKNKHEKLVLCPNCASLNISIRYHCPHHYCGSMDIERKNLIEHLACGAINVEDRYRKGDSMVCPGCNARLEALDVDYRKAGEWFECRACGRRFDTPVLKHFCRKCKQEFTAREAVLVDAYSYQATKQALEEFSGGFTLLQPLSEVLEKRGYRVESPGLVKGMSGTNVAFNIFAVRGGDNRRLAVDLALSDQPVGEEPVIALFAKAFDTSPVQPVLVAVPGLAEKARRLASTYRIEVVEGKDSGEVVKAFEAFLKQAG